MEKIKKIAKTFRFKKDIIDRLEAVAKSDNRSLNNYVNHILMEYVERLKSTKP